MDQTLIYESPNNLHECIIKILEEPQEYRCKWGTALWYEATKISSTQVLIIFKGGQCRGIMRTQYLMDFLPREQKTRISLCFQKELFGLPPMTPPFDIDLFMKQKLNAVREQRTV